MHIKILKWQYNLANDMKCFSVSNTEMGIYVHYCLCFSGYSAH